MSTREYAKTLIDQIPESKLIFVVPYLRGLRSPMMWKCPMRRLWPRLRKSKI